MSPSHVGVSFLPSALARPLPNDSFGTYQLSASISNALEDSGYRTPRPIQSETLSASLAGRDVLGLSATGTGKTAAFAVPVLERLAREVNGGKRALILAPTRELATQIEREIVVLARYTDVFTTTVFGGVSVRTQSRRLEQHPDIVVGCPGRVLHLLEQGTMDPSLLETLVIDEADCLLDLGFRRQLMRILAKLPNGRQTLLFSATMSREIRSLADEILSSPHVVDLGSAQSRGEAEHILYSVREEGKSDLLNRVLSRGDCATAIVFMRTKDRAREAAQQIRGQGLRAIALQGDMSQSQRNQAMTGFREGRFDILVATDIAARGLDVPGVDDVVNFDVPKTPESYIHRIGSAGRSEGAGRACTFVTPNDRQWLRDTEQALGQGRLGRTSPLPCLVPAFGRPAPASAGN